MDFNSNRSSVNMGDTETVKQAIMLKNNLIQSQEVDYDSAESEQFQQSNNENNITFHDIVKDKSNAKSIYNMNFIFWYLPIQYVSYFFGIVALIEFIFACMVRHFFGIFVAFVVILLLLFEIITYFKKVARINPKIHIGIRLVWLAIFCFMIKLLVIRFQSMTPKFSDTQFPTKCTGLRNCVRIALKNENMNEGLYPLEIETNFHNVGNFVNKFIGENASSWVVKRNECYIKSNFITPFWGYIDDFGVNFCCLDTVSLVQIQSESRLGGYDYGYNTDRVNDFLTQLEIQEDKFEFEKCSG